MAEKITFPSAVLLAFGRKFNAGGKASFSSSITDAQRKAMNWDEIPECANGANLDGDLQASVLTLTPKDKELQRNAIELSISRVRNFQVVRLELEGKRDKGHRQELRFSVEFGDDKGARKLEEYMLTVGEGKSTLAVSYTKQEQLEMAGEAEPQAAAEINA